jgi:hypothetical protein
VGWGVVGRHLLVMSSERKGVARGGLGVHFGLAGLSVNIGTGRHDDQLPKHSAAPDTI